MNSAIQILNNCCLADSNPFTVSPIKMQEKSQKYFVRDIHVKTYHAKLCIAEEVLLDWYSYIIISSRDMIVPCNFSFHIFVCDFVYKVLFGCCLLLPPSHLLSIKVTILTDLVCQRHHMLIVKYLVYCMWANSIFHWCCVFFIVGVMVKDIFPELRLDVPNIEKQIAPNMLCLRDIEVLLHLPF